VNGAFGTGELSATTPWVTMPVVKPPEECPERIMPERFNRSIFNHLEARIALGRPFEQIDGTPGSPVSALWSRVPGHFELSAATLAIFGTTSRADFLSRSAFPRWPQPRQHDSHRHARADRLGTHRDSHARALRWLRPRYGVHVERSGTLLATASQSIAARAWDMSLSRFNSTVG